jgi:transposase
MLLVLNVVYDKHIPAQVPRDLYRSRTWASDWLKRYREEGIEGLRDRPKKWSTNRHTRRDSIQDKKPIIIKQTRLDYKTGLRYHNTRKSLHSFRPCRFNE